MNINYQYLKMFHIIGVVMFVGNIMVTALWKTTADRTRDANIIAFAQRLVTITDFIFTGFGAGLVFVTGFLMASQYFDNFLSIKWIAWGLGLFIISGLIWITALIPIQIKEAQMARKFVSTGQIPEEYWRVERLWMILGIIATILPFINIYFMVVKPN